MATVRGEWLQPNRGVSPEKTKRIQFPMRVIWANSCSAGKMPRSGVTSRAGMGDNLSEIVV
jgi:hypothetical protein